MSQVVVFGGGTGISNLLSGLKLFPIDVTTVVAVSDNGSSTGVLKEELDIPAVGDLGKVLLSMANVDKDFVDLLRYRFSKEGTLYNHPVRNIMLAALIDTKGSLTEDKVELVGETKRGKDEFFGEEDVSLNIKRIRRLHYDKPVHISDEIKQKIKEADLIIFSPGSLYTSILPHLLADEIVESVREAAAPLMYVSNLVTQPGETDGYSVADHLDVLNSYLDGRKIDVVVANSGDVDQRIRKKYLDTENKTVVGLEEIDRTGVEVITGDIFSIEDEKIRHDALKTAYLIFSYIMEREEK